jgi:quercetin dioxygenase-like cupin family protein
MAMMNRREVVVGVSAFALLRMVAEAQESNLAVAKVFKFDALPSKKSANGGESRAVMKGTLPTGEFLEMHETVLPVGQMPHPPHRHTNSEFIVLQEGTVDYLSDGKVERVEVGDVIYTASNKPHGMRNVGRVAARYFVVSVGVQNVATEVTLKPAS